MTSPNKCVFGNVLKRINFVIRGLIEPVEVGRGDNVTAATAKVEIWRGPFSVSSQVNGACSCSEGRRQIVREAARGCIIQ